MALTYFKKSNQRTVWYVWMKIKYVDTTVGSNILSCWNVYNQLIETAECYSSWEGNKV